MAIVKLSMSPDWELEYPEADPRGRTVKDASGSVVGTVADLWIDEVTEEVARLELDTGQQLWLRQVGLENGELRWREEVLPGDNFARTGDQVSHRNLPGGERMRTGQSIPVRPVGPENLFADQLEAAAHPKNAATPIFEEQEDAAPDRHVR